MKTQKTSLLLFTIFFSLSSISFSQDTTLDSLNTYTKEDSIRVNLLNRLANNILHKNPNKSLEYIEESILLSDKINYKKGTAESLFLKGSLQLQLSKGEKAREYLQKALALYETIGDQEGVSKCLKDFGTSYFYQGDYLLAKEYYEKALVVNEKRNAKDKISASLNNVGMIHSIQGEYEKALEYYNKSLLIEKELNNEAEIAKVYNNIGIIHTNRSNYPLAIEYYTKALTIHEQSGNELKASSALYNIGLVYKLYENYDKALVYYKKSLAIEEKHGSKRNIAFSLMGIGSVYTKQGEQKQAEEFLKKALVLFTEIKDDTHISSCLNNLGDVFFNDKNYSLALKNYHESLKINSKKTVPSSSCHAYLRLGVTYYKRKEYTKALSNVLSGQRIANEFKFLKYQKEASELLSKLYSNTKEYKKAYENHLEYKKLNDSIFNKKNIEKITQLKYEHEYSERLVSSKEREDTLKEEVKTIDKELEISQQEKLWGVIGFLSLIIALSIIIFLLRIRSLKAAGQNILTEQKLLRSQMTPHFIFNSLSVLQGIILNKENKKSIKYLSGFSKLLRLTLENSRDKVVSLKNELKAIEHYLILQNLGAKTPYIYKITVDKDVNENEIVIPPMLIQPFIENAVEHGFKNKKEDRQIILTIKFDKTSLICSIIDNGIGIDSYKNESFNAKKSLSTTITSERLKMFSKEFSQRTALSIKDRKFNNEQGTIVILTLPYKIIKND